MEGERNVRRSPHHRHQSPNQALLCQSEPGRESLARHQRRLIQGQDVPARHLNRGVHPRWRFRQLRAPQERPGGELLRPRLRAGCERRPGCVWAVQHRQNYQHFHCHSVLGEEREPECRCGDLFDFVCHVAVWLLRFREPVLEEKKKRLMTLHDLNIYKIMHSLSRHREERPR